MTASPVYVIVPSRALSGAEKRFMGMWLHLQRRGLENIKLVTFAEAFELASVDQELRGVVEYERNAVLLRSAGGAVRRAIAPVLFRAWRADRSAVFHHIMIPPGPLELFSARRSVFTIPDPYLSHYRARGLVQLYLGAALAGRVDVLDPVLLDHFQAKLPWKRGRFTLTPNSYVDTSSFVPLPFAEKTNTIVFLGRFVDEKQVHRLVDCLPALDERLKRAGVAAPSFRILGDGDPTIASRCASLASRIDVQAYHEQHPDAVLRSSKVFLSLQRSNNYPSKSLLEGMAAGNVPVVTDVGTSRRIAPDHLAYYVPRDFTAEDLAAACTKIFAMPAAAFEDRVRAMRGFLEESFSLRTMADYFLNLYAAAQAA